MTQDEKRDKISDDMPYPPGHELDGVSKPLSHDPIRSAAKTICARFHSTSPNDIDFVYRLLRREVERERERIEKQYKKIASHFINDAEMWDSFIKQINRIRQGGK